MHWLWVIGFGALGVSTRFSIDTWIAKYGFNFPFGTLAINIFGCLIAGILMGFGLQKSAAEIPVRIGIVVGFCGGFTTFSGYGLQFIQLLNEGKLTSAIIYGVGTPILCLLSVAGGLLLTRSFI